jgi:hypothetical protein
MPSQSNKQKPTQVDAFRAVEIKFTFNRFHEVCVHSNGYIEVVRNSEVVVISAETSTFHGQSCYVLLEPQNVNWIRMHHLLNLLVYFLSGNRKLPSDWEKMNGASLEWIGHQMERRIKEIGKNA